MCYMLKLSTVMPVINRAINCYVLLSVPRIIMIIDAACPLPSSPKIKHSFSRPPPVARSRTRQGVWVLYIPSTCPTDPL